MARMTRKEKLWEGFATELAGAIAQRFFRDRREAAAAHHKDVEHEILRKYYLPLKKQLDKLPDEVVSEDTRLFIGKPRTGESYYDNQNYSLMLEEKSRVPRVLRLPAEVMKSFTDAISEINKLQGEQHRLFNDLLNNIVVAESFDEVVEKWPEARELAEEISLTYATKMCVPLSKILGKYTPALPAPVAAIAAE